jgi:hypothetical protein
VVLVHATDPHVLLVGKLPEVGEHTDPGVEVREVDAPELGDARRERGVDLRRIGDVGRERERADLVRDLFRRVAVDVPSATSLRAVPRPMPDPPPVTSATRPFSSMTNPPVGRCDR